MRLAGRLFLGGGVFFLVVAGIYFLMSHDEAGGMALLLTAGLSAMIGFYLVVTARRLPGTARRTTSVGEIWEADPDYGHYSPHSWAPLMVGASAAIVFAGLAFAAWIVVAGAILVILSSAYWLFEYYSGPETQF